MKRVHGDFDYQCSRCGHVWKTMSKDGRIRIVSQDREKFTPNKVRESLDAALERNGELDGKAVILN